MQVVLCELKFLNYKLKYKEKKIVLGVCYNIIKVNIIRMLQFIDSDQMFFRIVIVVDKNRYIGI